jgi:hypothetical protein
MAENALQNINDKATGNSEGKTEASEDIQLL